MSIFMGNLSISKRRLTFLSSGCAGAILKITEGEELCNR